MSESLTNQPGELITITLETMANGGKAIGRDNQDRAVFIPFTIPGEVVRARITSSRQRYAHAQLVEVLEPSPERVEPLCPHFGPCGGCHFQHMNYQAQLRFKREVILDQMQRIGKMGNVPVEPMLPNPEPWAYSAEAAFSLTADGDLGFWSPVYNKVIPIEECHIIKEDLLELFQQIDLSFPSLHRLTLRVGDSGDLMAALEVEGDEVPSLNVDIPVSINLLLPDGTTANLLGDNHVVRVVKDRPFRVTAGCYFFPSAGASELVVDAVLEQAGSIKGDHVLELSSGVGMLTAFLAEAAGQVTGIESNPEAITDLATNLADLDNVTIYQGSTQEILPLIEDREQLVVVQPPTTGLPPAMIDELEARKPGRLIYISSDVATLARDGNRLSRIGLEPAVIQPIDMWPQTFHTLTVSLWEQSS